MVFSDVGRLVLVGGLDLIRVLIGRRVLIRVLVGRLSFNWIEECRAVFIPEIVASIAMARYLVHLLLSFFKQLFVANSSIFHRHSVMIVKFC